MCFFRKKRERKRALEAEKAALAQKQAEQAVVVEKKVEEPQVEQKPQPTPPVSPVVEKKVAAKEDGKVTQEQVPVEKSAPKAVVKAAPKTEEKPADQEEITDEKSSKIPKVQKYHVSQNKDEDSDSFKKWRVRKEGSTKTIKFFDTQKEAIAFAEQLAESAGSSVVIHKVDGSIRKQDYTKKES